MTNKKTNAAFWSALTLFSLTGQIAWVVENMYLNVFIYKIFQASPDDISLMVSASAVTAALTTVFMGALSDKVGKRKAFIYKGYILWGISILGFAFLNSNFLGAVSSAFGYVGKGAALGITLTVILDSVMTFFGSTANDAAFNAWLTDSATPEKRGAAEGINAMMPLVSILVVFGGFMFLDLNRPSSWTVIFTIIGVLTIIIGIVGAFLIKEPDILPDKTPYFSSIIYGFKPTTLKCNPLMYLSLAGFVIFNISVQIFMPYLIIYYEAGLGMSNYTLIMAPAVILASVFTFFWGRVFDSHGFSFSGSISAILLGTGYLMLYLTISIIPVFLGSLLMMCGYLSGMAVFGAMIRNHTPLGDSGKLQGVRIFAQVLIPGIIGPFIGKSVLKNAKILIGSDGTESFIPNANIFIASLIALVFLFPMIIVIKSFDRPRTADLFTPFEKDLEKGPLPWQDYPRPSLVRDSYINLNGKWRFKAIRRNKEVICGEILVPFPPESRLSGINKAVKDRDILIYERDFTIDESFMSGRVLIHFGACDQYTKVFLNSKECAKNIGGYLPFSADITDILLLGKNTLRVEVSDPTDTDLPYGKQTKKRGGMWYTKTSGIWQTVWMESVPYDYIQKIKITPNLSGIDLEVVGGAPQKCAVINGKEYPFSSDKIRIDIPSPILWSPDAPHLYTLILRSGEDEVKSYFALRTFSVSDKGDVPTLLLNGNPIFCHGLLDQGYFPDGIFLPASPRGFEEDVLKMKACGFNTLRKHIKLEPELFYYYCDKHGMLVFQDMINSGKYSFIMDTALPTVFLKRGFTHTATKRRREEFIKTSLGITEALRNHPSVVYYTVFNEGWGQFSAEEMYETLKKEDPTRVWDTTSGWFKTDSTDIESDHVYFKKICPKKDFKKPWVLSEFGGYSCKIEGHYFNFDKTYGYRFFKDRKELEKAISDLYVDEIIPAIHSGLSGAVITQVSDVEDETNGLLTYDRQILKISENSMNGISKKLYLEFENSHSKNT